MSGFLGHLVDFLDFSLRGDFWTVAELTKVSVSLDIGELEGPAQKRQPKSTK
jgi:hypothetical protein